MINPVLRKSAFAKRLIAWYQQHGRSTLPWQQDQSAYSVWISEIMLQQTQVATVIPYFQRFMQRFPNIETLANATLDEVLHHWTGLGYYSRARNIHKAARLILEKHGDFPSEFADILALPGIGRSTAGAISAFSFSKRQAILDGNVKRVLARVQAISGWPGNKPVHDLLWEYADYFTPDVNVREYTQAIMDLGALICTQTKPQCEQCPFTDRCVAYQQGKPTAYPSKKPKTIKPVKKTHLLILSDPNGQYWLQKRPPSGIWGGLYGFPEIASLENVLDYVMDHYAIRLKSFTTLPTFRHTFTHFHLDITPIIAPLSNPAARKLAIEDAIWYNSKQPANIGLAAPVKKLLTQLELVS